MNRSRVSATKGRPGLLDVNVLIALIDPQHEFHGIAHGWFQENRRQGWATCPITENGCLRVLSMPGYPVPGLTVGQVHDILAEFVGIEGHRFWSDSVSILDRDSFDLTNTGPRSLTDLYLLRLAAANHGRLVTFDRTIRWERVKDCSPDDLCLLSVATVS